MDIKKNKNKKVETSSFLYDNVITIPYFIKRNLFKKARSPLSSGYGAKLLDGEGLGLCGEILIFVNYIHSSYEGENRVCDSQGVGLFKQIIKSYDIFDKGSKLLEKP